MSGRLKFTVGTSYGTSAELLALLDAIIGATPSTSEREGDLYNALSECCDVLLKDLSPEELHRVLACYWPPQRRRGRGKGKVP